MLVFLSRHSHSSSFCFLDRVAYYEGFLYRRWTPLFPIPDLLPNLGTSTFEVFGISLDPHLFDVLFLVTGSSGRIWVDVDSKQFLFPDRLMPIWTLAIASCNPASLYWIPARRYPTRVCSVGSWYLTYSSQDCIEKNVFLCWWMNFSREKLMYIFHTRVCSISSCVFRSCYHFS